MERLDRFLAENGFSKSRERAKREILAGWVRINGETCRDVSLKVTGGEEITVSRPGGEYVSRGAYKLEKALDYFGIDVAGATVADMGASTGGFTDCLLKRGALHVYAVDVGYGQLDYSLRIDNRVTVMERTNVRDIHADMFDRCVTFITGDLSFISVTRVFPVLGTVFPGAPGIFLIKPQFEAAPSEHKKGVVRDSNVHYTVLSRVCARLAKQGVQQHGLTFSPIRGPKGNIEFLLHFSLQQSEGIALPDSVIRTAVDAAWQNTR